MTSPSSSHGCSVAQRHLQLGELNAVVPAVSRAPQQDVRRHRQPPGQAAGDQHDGVKHAVVRPCVRQQREPAAQPAHVADDQRAGPHPAAPAAVGADGHPHRPVAQVTGGRDRVGEPAQPLLERLAGAVQHLGIQAKARHHDEQRPVHPARVDRLLHAAERDLERLVQAHRQAHVAGQQVACPHRDDRQRHPGAGDPLRARGDRPVTAAGKHQVDPGGHRRLGLAAAGILRRRLQPERLVPAVIVHGPADRLAEGLVVIQLGRVHHDCGPAHRRTRPHPILRPTGAARLRRRGGASHPPLPPGLRQRRRPWLVSTAS